MGIRVLNPPSQFRTTVVIYFFCSARQNPHQQSSNKFVLHFFYPYISQSRPLKVGLMPLVCFFSVSQFSVHILIPYTILVPLQWRECAPQDWSHATYLHPLCQSVLRNYSCTHTIFYSYVFLTIQWTTHAPKRIPLVCFFYVRYFSVTIHVPLHFF